MFIEHYKGFDIHATMLPEDAPPADCFDLPEDDMQEILGNIESGYLQWFCVRIDARKAGRLLGETYLGGCLYKDLQDFVATSGYYEDLRSEAIDEARRTINEINRE